MTKEIDDALSDRRIRRTRKAIRAALTSLLQEMSVEQITIKDIASEADIGYTTFFRHFPTKEAALVDLANSTTSDMIGQTLPLIQTDDSRAACLALCGHIDRNRAVWSALLAGGAANVVREALLEQTLERSKLWPSAASWLPSKAGAALATGLVVETLTWWLSKAAELSAAQVAEIMDRLFVSALVDGAERRSTPDR